MLSISPEELEASIRTVVVVGHSRSGGPGGQNVNKVNTRVTLHVPLSHLGLTDEEVVRVRAALHGRVNANDELVVHSSETRSQHRNLEAAYDRAREMIERASAPPPRPHRPSRPGKAARERRLREKRVRAQAKQLRRPPSMD